MAGLRIILIRKWDIQEGSVFDDIFRQQSFTSLQLRGIYFNHRLVKVLLCTPTD